MTLKEFISTLKIETKIELLENDEYLCDTTSRSKILELFYGREIINWYSNKLNENNYKAVITVNITGECEE